MKDGGKDERKGKEGSRDNSRWMKRGVPCRIPTACDHPVEWPHAVQFTKLEKIFQFREKVN